MKVGSTVWSWSEGFCHGEQRFPSTGRPLIWRLHQHIKYSFLNLYFCNKCVTTFWSGFRFLEASVLHQLEGEGHVVNLREQKTEQSYRHRGPFQSITHSPSVRSSQGWGRSCTEGQNNLQAAPSATPSRHRQQTTPTNSEHIESVTLCKDTREMKSSWHILPAFPAPSPPGSACSGVCWQRWWETGSTINTGYFPFRRFLRLKGNITVFTTFSLSGAWSSSVSKASLSVGMNKWLTQTVWSCLFYVSLYRIWVKRSFQRVLLEMKMCLRLTKSPHHHSEKDRERGGVWNCLCVRHLDAKAPALTLWCSSALSSRGRSEGSPLVSAQIKTKWAELRLPLTIYTTLTLTTTTCTDTCSGSLMGAWKCIARSTSR